MAEQAGAHPFVEDHRELAGFRAARAEPRDRPPARRPADVGAFGEVFQKDFAVIIVIALHLLAGAGQNRGADAVAGTAIAAEKAVAGGDRDVIDAPAGLGAFGIGDAVDGAGGFLASAGAGAQVLGRWLVGVEHLDGRGVLANLGGRRQPRERILRRRARHRNGPRAGRVQGRRAGIRGGHAGLALADEHA